jgi:hypothetical protein
MYIVWGSKLQTETAQSSTKSEYIALSQSFREVINIIDLIKELKTAGLQFNNTIVEVKCRAFEIINGALVMATIHKLRPRMKHINVKYHQFRSAGTSGIISMYKIGK